MLEPDAIRVSMHCAEQAHCAYCGWLLCQGEKRSDHIVVYCANGACVACGQKAKLPIQTFTLERIA
jgi:hypothetical protein